MFHNDTSTEREEDRPSGIGRIIQLQIDYWEFNSIYEGEVCSNGIPNGFGRLITSEGEQVIGYFKHGRPHGKVIYVDSDQIIVFEGLVANSPISLETSCLPFKTSNISRLTYEVPYEEAPN